jgi:hypothetical protein
MRCFAALAILMSLFASMTVGCSEKSKTQSTTTVETPQGSTTETTTTEVKKSGENPPATP